MIVEIDDRAVSELARWPWHRDAMAALILQAADAGAKVIGLDVVFAEPDLLWKLVTQAIGERITKPVLKRTQRPADPSQN